MNNIKTRETAKLTIHNHDTGESALVEVVYNFYGNPGSYDEPPSNDIELIEVKNAPEWATDDLIIGTIDMFESELGENDVWEMGDDYDEYNSEWEN